ncbi:hypothetical protein D046_2556A, partial [Vibrio parahaemolyticus V-223/04]
MLFAALKCERSLYSSFKCPLPQPK